MNGTHGHFHETDGFGTKGKAPSWTLTPGQPGNRLSGVSESSIAAQGKRRITNFTITPFLPSDVLDSWHTILAQKSVMLQFSRWSAMIIALFLSW